MTESKITPTASLKVDRSELVEGLQALARHAKPRKGEEGILRFVNGSLQIAVSGGEIEATATGHWPGEARVAASLLLALAKSAPMVDPLPFVIQSDRLFVASTSIACTWQKAGDARLDLPIDATLLEILRTAAGQSESAIARSGLHTVVQDARRQRDELLDKAVKILEPLGITRDELTHFIDGVMSQSQTQPAGTIS